MADRHRGATKLTSALIRETKAKTAWVREEMIERSGWCVQVVAGWNPLEKRQKIARNLHQEPSHQVEGWIEYVGISSILS